MLRSLPLIFLLVFCSSVYAVTPPANVVYRVDDRDTSDIFVNGFESYGTNDSVDEHVSGSSIRNRSSAWISTTDSTDTAIRIGNARFNLNASMRNRTTWIYEIAQTENMYDFNRILEDQASQWFMGSETRDHLSALRMVYGPQREIGALRSILGNQVVRARQFSWDPVSGSGQFRGEWINNPNYNDTLYRNTHMNSGLYRFSMATNYIVGIANTAIFLAASWCIGQGSPKTKSDNQTLCGESGAIEYSDNEVLMSQSARTNYFPYDL